MHPRYPAAATTTYKKYENLKKSDSNWFWELLYNSDCNNMIIHRLFPSDIEHALVAEREREASNLLLAQHLTMKDLPS